MTKTSKKILTELSSHESISLSSLNKKLKISNRTIRDNVSNLVKENVICISVNGDDLRRKMIRLKNNN